PAAGLDRLEAEAPRDRTAVGGLVRLAAPVLLAVGERRPRERPPAEAGRVALLLAGGSGGEGGERGERGERGEQQGPHGSISFARGPWTVTSISTSSS